MRRAFTLIELLVVMAIIGLLVAITIPAMGEARRIARKTTCGTNLHSIGQAVHAYLTTNHPTRYPWVAPMPSVNTDLPAIYEVLRVEVRDQREVFRCPADRNLLSRTIPNARETYFESEGTSYEWNQILNGKTPGQDVLSSTSHGHGLRSWEVPVMYDYEAYHGGPNRMGSLMTLYADFHVAPDKWQDRQPGSGTP